MSEHDDFAASIGATPVEASHDDFAASIGATPVEQKQAIPDVNLANTADDVWHGVKAAGTGLVNSVLHPIDTAKGMLHQVTDASQNAYDDARTRGEGKASGIASAGFAGAIEGGKIALSLSKMGVPFVAAAQGADTYQAAIDAGHSKDDAFAAAYHDAVKTAAGLGVAHAAPIVASKLASPIASAAKWAGNKVATGVLDLPEQAVEAIAKNPELYPASKTAPSLNELSDAVESGAKESGAKQSVLANQAWEQIQNTQDNLGPNTVSEMIAKVKKLGDSTKDFVSEKTLNGGANQQAQKSAMNALNAAQMDLGSVKNLTDLKSFLKSVDDNINWDAPQDAVKNATLKEYRFQMDQVLKLVVPGYEETMGALADETDNLAKVKSGLSLKNSYDSSGERELVRSDLTNPKMDTIVKGALGEKSKDQLIGQLDNLDPEIKSGIEARSLRNILDKDTARGSRSTVAGSVVGGGVGLAAHTMGLGPVGAAAITAGGALLGYARDTYGRELGAKIIQIIEHDGLGKMLNNKFGKTLIDAAAKGSNSLAIAHYLLSQKDPAYQALQQYNKDK